MISKFLLGVCAGIVLFGCKKEQTENIIARAGEKTLTREEFHAWAGKDADSLSESERWNALTEWVESALVEQEAQSSKLTEDPKVRVQEQKLRSRLYRSMLLSRYESRAPSAESIASYYETHRAEFRKPGDSYLIESFWSESEDSLKTFRRLLSRGDTSGHSREYVISEGKWLADAEQLEPAQLSEVKKLATNDLSPVVSFGEGFRLIRLLETYPSGTQLSLEAVSADIRERLLIEQSQRRQEQWLKELKGRYPVEVFWEEPTK